MTGADRQRFAVVMTGLGVAFDVAVTRERIELYREALADLRIEALEWAAKATIRELTFFPKAKELRDYAGIAPRAVVPVMPQRETVLVEELESSEEVREKLAAVVEVMNRKFGTTFAVGESMGRPALVSLRGGQS